ncbi:hypothetical protein K490DRAFT_58600 [Saccharata proteae CBS 121410]|uniref:BTB domain-containing protein n=1 Tax=Saccharata proteae CBS 121410 TaxID=1314787 RepID=A0A9P4HT34_9PEZI|nr:hypothetical protein K490DRAFT_58600 [Saccharata proteae CBS 121410]
MSNRNTLNPSVPDDGTTASAKRKRQPSTEPDAAADVTAKPHDEDKKSGVSSDGITVKFFGQQKKVRKTLLASESVYFKNMFEREKWAESRLGTIELKWRWPIDDNDFDADEQNKKNMIEMYQLMFQFICNGNYRSRPIPGVMTRRAAAAGANPDQPEALKLLQHRANTHIRAYQIAQYYQVDKMQKRAETHFQKALTEGHKSLKPPSLKQDFIAQLYARIPHGAADMKRNLMMRFEQAVRRIDPIHLTKELEFLKEEPFNQFTADSMVYYWEKPHHEHKLCCNNCTFKWHIACKGKEWKPRAVFKNCIRCPSCGQGYPIISRLMF